jgi:hypothetical protein
MQVVGDQKVRIVPDVAVSGATSGTGLVDAMVGMLLRGEMKGDGSVTPSA